MYSAHTAFLDQMRKAAGDNRTIVWLIEKLGQRYARDGADITEQVLADARKRLTLAEKIIAAHA